MSSLAGASSLHASDPTSGAATGRSRAGRLRIGVRRRVLGHRRALAAVLVALAVLLALHDLRPPGPATTGVWTAARDLTSGATIAPEDLTRSAYTPAEVPDGAIRDARAVVGRTVAAPLRRGQPLTDLSVLGRPLLDADEGRIAVPVRISDAGVVALLHVGDRIDLVAVDPDTGKEPTVVATDARVVALPSGGDLDTAGSQPGRLLVVSVSPPESTSVAAAGVLGFLTLTLTP